MAELLDAMLADAGMQDVYRGGIEQHGLLEPPDGPAVLLYDIETTPMLAWLWGAFNQNVYDVDQIKQSPYQLCFAYQWLGTDDVGFVAIWHDPAFEPWSTDDRWVAERLACLFDRADVTVAHNGDKFDVRKANTFFLSHDLLPPSTYQTVDTLKETKRYFAHVRNNLDYLVQHHGIGEKVDHAGWRLWLDCMAGDQDAQDTMEAYNRQDVELLRGWYLKIRPWVGMPGKKAHPNMGHFAKGERVCSNCGSPRLIPASTPHRGAVSEWEVWRCTECGAQSRARVRKTQRFNTGVKTL